MYILRYLRYVNIVLIFVIQQNFFLVIFQIHFFRNVQETFYHPLQHF